MHIPDANTDTGEIGGQVFRHLFRQRGDKRSLALFGARVDFSDQVVDLPVDRAHGYDGVKQPRRPDDLFDNLRRPGLFIVCRRRRNINHLMNALLKFIELQRSVVKG